MSNSIKMTFGFKNTDFTRTYTIGNVESSICADTEAIKTAVQEINSSLEGGTSGGLDSFIRADDYNAAQSIGAFNHINSVTIYESSTQNIVVEEGE